MRYIKRLRVKKRRLGVSIGALSLYVVLLVADTHRTFFSGIKNLSPFVGVYFGFSVVVALSFLAVGILVWLYARNRFIALLLFCFSVATMVTFAVETAATANDPLFSLFGGVSSQLAIFLFTTLLLLFPKNHLAWPTAGAGTPANNMTTQHTRGWRYYRVLLLRGYVIVLCIMGVKSAGDAVLFATPFAPSRQVQAWLNTMDYAYSLLALLTVFLTIAISYRQSVSQRERQQQRLLLIGIILAFAPLLFLTILPGLLNWPARYEIDSQITTLTLILLPLSLGYSILRYQILVFDAYIRRVIAWMVGCVSLAILAYLTVALGNFLVSEILVRTICIAVVMAFLAPLVWYVARQATERLFFSENVHYRQLVERFDRLSSETIDLLEAAQLLTQATINVFETTEVCLFVLDDDTGNYQLYPPLPQEAPADGSEADLSSNQLVRSVVSAIGPSTYAGAGECDWLGAYAPAVGRVEKAPRPLLLSEAVRDGDEEESLGLSRYLRSTSPLGVDPLLVPVRIQGKMIAMLILGRREAQEQYAGPDFEAIELILSRFASILETARLYAQESRYVAILNTLYSASAMSSKVFQSTEDIAHTYAEIAAKATQTTAKIWLYDEKDGLLRRTGSVGSGPFLTPENTVHPVHDSDWLSCFYEGESSHSRKGDPAHSLCLPPCLAETPRFPFAWIPLSRGQQHLGVLALTYARPHVFSQQEKHVLEMFASQCAAALENTRITSELRVAYEHQKELDQLKDQFIITASHELRTPLTAVMGYLELLSEYAGTLTPELLTDFIAKAHRGCDELNLMVGNIMDASRVQIDAEKLRLGQVFLAESVQHILEIMEAMTRREKRTIQVDIPQSLVVAADDLRLRQVLLNLVNNALKYSPAGTGVEITAREDDGLVSIFVRDHGLGVPPEEQAHLFERFMRLERDMNSPVRGAGLGLYICQQLIEAMGGRIWIESTGVAGEGSTFGFTLRRSLVTQSLAS